MNIGQPLISICIPAYKRIEFLQRLLNSIASQNFRDFEVVLTDDSPDNSVRELCKQYAGRMSLRYFKNDPVLGTPENWNEGIRQARGEWIKIMHDDDWFTHDRALAQFHEQTLKYPGCKFFFSAFQNVDEDSGKNETVRCSSWELFLLRSSPLHLFKKVYVGNPSCTLVRRNLDLFYDNRFKYVVDFEYYIRCIQKTGEWHYIDEVLLQIGFNQEQVTKYTFRVKEVQIPENHLLLEKMGAGILRNVLVFDYYWRLYRNLGIRKTEDIKTLYNAPVHPIIRCMLRIQGKLPANLLKSGFISKPVMFLTYLRSLLISV